MPAYHSIFLDAEAPHQIGGFPLSPLRTRTRGPAVTLPLLSEHVLDLANDHESYDIVDEVFYYFRANVFFRNFEIKGPADRVTLYGILYISQLLGLIKPTMTRREAEKAVFASSLDPNFSIPGDHGFPSQTSDVPVDAREADTLRQYMSQLRQEIAVRLLWRVYKDNENTPCKWWLSFTKRKFINKSL